MKIFKLIFILIVFFKTETLLSENNLFNVNNIKLEKKNLGESFIPSKIKDEKSLISLYSYGFIIRPHNLRSMSIDNSKVDFITVKDPISILELKNYYKLKKSLK